MKIIYFPALGRAAFKEETTEPFIGGKILTSVTDPDGKAVASSVLLCGSRFHISGARDGILDSAVREGTSPLSVEIGGKTFPVGAAIRESNNVTFKSTDTYATFIEAAVLADTAYRKVVEYERRIKKLETASNGVDLLHLH